MNLTRRNFLASIAAAGAAIALKCNTPKATRRPNLDFRSIGCLVATDEFGNLRLAKGDDRPIGLLVKIHGEEWEVLTTGNDWSPQIYQPFAQ